MRVVRAPECSVRIVQAVFNEAKSEIRMNGLYSDEFEVKVGVYQGSALSPLIFIIALEALPKEFRTGYSWELVHVDDLT